MPQLVVGARDAATRGLSGPGQPDMRQSVPLTGRDAPVCRNSCPPDRPEHPDMPHPALPITRGAASPALDPRPRLLPVSLTRANSLSFDKLWREVQMLLS
ncbi:hypothetical protein GCM10011608_20390 [Micromonospora sonchi]|uniref:Uncharacterized protein n=1 Tax=Micromonospora sonchi TaxID=1763543 RepID=A0A917WVB0_9ACTN|nr:hypothetical protein GCM10011608_20390 [Micromonospora sonchi]